MFLYTRSQNNFRQDSMDELCLKEEALKQRDEMVSCLLEELVKVRQSCAESEDMIRGLKTKMEELEEDKKTLRESTPDNSVAHLQDELIASKLREAEASLSLKDLKQRVQELSQQWQRHLQVRIPLCADVFTMQTITIPSFRQEQRNHEHQNQAAASATTTAVDATAAAAKKLMFWDTSGQKSSNELHQKQLEEELMSTRIREMETLTELKELRLKVMELETQVQVSTNQLRRQDEEAKRVRDELETALQREKDAAGKAREQQHR